MERDFEDADRDGDLDGEREDLEDLDRDRSFGLSNCFSREDKLDKLTETFCEVLFSGLNFFNPDLRAILSQSVILVM